MTPKVIQVLKLFVPTLRVVAAYQRAKLLGMLSFFQVMVVEMIVAEHRAAVLECLLLARKSLVANAARALSRVHQ